MSRDGNIFAHIIDQHSLTWSIGIRGLNTHCLYAMSLRTKPFYTNGGSSILRCVNINVISYKFHRVIPEMIIKLFYQVFCSIRA